MRQKLHRWIHSPVTGGIPRAAFYCAEWRMPMIAPDGTALVLCDLDPGLLHDARQDTELIVLPSLHSDDPVPAAVMTSYATHLTALTAGLAIGAPNPPLRAVLAALAGLHLGFEPDQ